MRNTPRTTDVVPAFDEPIILSDCAMRRVLAHGPCDYAVDLIFQRDAKVYGVRQQRYVCHHGISVITDPPTRKRGGKVGPGVGSANGRNAPKALGEGAATGSTRVERGLAERAVHPFTVAG